jgi:RNA polymerase sigma factor (sigma-70 family)
MNFSTTGTGGDDGDFESFYKDAFKRLTWLLASRYGISPENAQDLVQEAMMCVYRKLGDGIGGMSESSLLAYLTEAVRNKAKDHLRVHSREVPWGAAPHSDRHSTAIDLEDVHVCDVFKRLSDELREIAVLYYLVGLTRVQIALVTGMNINTVGSRLRRARKQLRDHLLPP